MAIRGTVPLGTGVSCVVAALGIWLAVRAAHAQSCDLSDECVVEGSASPCAGDCNNNGSVTVDELIKGVNIALGNALIGDCPAFDLDASRTITVDELIKGVNAALAGCPAPPPTSTAATEPAATTTPSVTATAAAPTQTPTIGVATATRGPDTPTQTPSVAATLPPSATVTMATATPTATGQTTATRTATDATTPTPTPPAAGAFKLLPTRLSLAIDDDASLLALYPSGAIIWSSSDPTVVTVDALGQLKALSKGSAIISAASGTDVATSTLTVYQTTGANPDPSSEALIAQALAGGRISAEQALMYRVFALFGDERLPPEFDGAPSDGPHHLLLRELATTIASLSSPTQDVLRPFLLPPIYAQSWYAQRLGLSAPAQAAAARQPAPSPTIHPCQVSRLYPQFYTRVSTAHFNIFYPTLGDPTFSPSTVATVALIASLVEEVYQADTGLLDRFPLPDTNEACNGGDGAVDIYYGPFAMLGVAGWTNSYPLAPELRNQNACANRPSYIMLNKQSREFNVAERSPEEARLMVKSILAHEILHVLQFAMPRQASCLDIEWLDEATSQWVMDYVVPTIPQGLPGEFGMEPGLLQISATYRKSGHILAEYLYSGHMKSIETPGDEPKLNGYSDYLFFQFLARKQTPAKIKHIFDAMVGGENSVEAIAAAVDMKSVWPDFAQTLWIGFDDEVLDYWATKDEYRFGLAKVYAGVETISIPQRLKDRLKTLEIDQEGQPRATFKLLDNALAYPGDYYEIDPRSMYYEHLKFSDPTVHSVWFLNPIAALPNRDFMKVQVLKKIGGEWQEVEDWTQDSYKQFCLDKKDERLEELLIIVSNSEANRDEEEPFRIPKIFPMRLSTSNVGCWKWQGTASTVTIITGLPSGDSTARATNVTFEVADVLPGRIVFEAASGTVNGNSTVVLGDCTTTSVGAEKTVVKDDIFPEGTIDVNLDLDLGFSEVTGEPPDRKLITLSGLSPLSTTITFACPDFTQITVDVNSWEWMKVSEPWLYTVSADGRTIEGRFIIGLTPIGGTTNTVWNFTALREQ